MDASQRAELRRIAPAVRFYSLPGLARATVPAQVGTTPGTFGPSVFIFPDVREVTAIQVIPALGTPEELAALDLQIFDEDNVPIFSDLIGDVTEPRLPFAMGCEAMFGRGLLAFPLKRLVTPGDRWTFTFRNSSAAPVVVAGVALFHTRIER